MADKEKSRVRVLELIRSQRETLFGAFSPSLTKIDKSNAWESITDEAKQLGLITSNKTAVYMRDVYWQNLRKRTLKKMDDYRKTGSAGGKDAKLDDIDHVVLDIIGMCFYVNLNQIPNHLLVSLICFLFCNCNGFWS